MKKIYLFAIMLATGTTQAQTDFEDISLSTYFDGSDLSGKDDGSGNYISVYTENNLSFNTTWNKTYSYWSGGWAFSNLTDSSLNTASQTYHSYSTSTDSRGNFAIGKSGSEITVNGTATFSTIEVSNNSYAAYSMTNGDNFSKQFTSNDWFELTVEGFNDEISTGTIKVMLADSLDSVPMILETWQTVDISSLGEVSKLTFTLNSSDVGDYGMNTPSFFAMDNLLYSKITFTSEPRTDFEDISLLPYFDGSDLSGTNDGLGNYTSTYTENNLSFNTTWDNSYAYWSSGWAFSNLTDSSLTTASQKYHSYSNGADSGENFAIGKSGSEITVNGTATFSTIEVSNNSYAAYSMTNGDDFAKQFMSDDWFELTIEGFNNEVSTGTVKVMLADSSDSAPKILETWQTVDISSLGEVSKLAFTLNSSDVGNYGMNTPSFFAVDNIIFEFTNSLNNLKNTNLFVYPNPATTKVNIPSNIESIDIYSINGNLVLKELSPSNSIDISFLTKGVYMLKAKSVGAISTTRLIVK
jgi:hypothetical protein